MANGNPRLEVEVAVSGLGKATKDFGTLQKELQNTSKEFSKANATALELESELRSLSTSLSRGAISQDKYDKEVKEVSVALASARQAAQQYQARISSLNATIEQGANAGRQYGNAMNNLQGVHDSVSKGIRGSTSVSLELSRALGDLPYGIQGAANNLQQLTTNLGYYTKNIREALIAQGQQATTMNVVKTALSGLISPISLITFGVSALTSALVLFDRSQQQANKEIKEADKEVKVLANSYSVLSNALKEDTSYKNAISSVNSLKINVGLAKEGIIDKKKVVEEYNKTIGDSAGKLKTFAEVEDFIVKKSDAYIQAMLLRASANLALEEAAKAAVEAQRLAINPPKVETKIVGDNSIANEFLTTQGRVIEQAGTFVRKKLTDDAKKTEKTFTDIAKDFQTKAAQINKQYGFNLFGDGKSGTTNQSKQPKDYLQQVRDIGQKSQFSLDIASSEGLDKELEKNKQKYKSYLDDLDKIEKQNRGKNVENAKQTQLEINNVRKQIIANQALEEQQIRLKYERDTQDLITSILNDAGLSRIKSRQQELDANVKYYDELANKHRENAQVLQAITEARKASENSINEKWDKKAYDDAEKLYTKIGNLEGKVFTGKTQETLKKQLDERLKQIEDFYKNIAKILEASGVDSSGAYAKMFESFGKVYEEFQKQDTNISDSLSKQVRNGISRGIGSAFSDLYSNIDNLGSNTYQVFKNTFDKLSGYVGNVMSDVIGRYLGEQLSTKIEKGDFKLDGLSTKTTQALVAGASAAGRVLGSMFKQTDATGQGIAGGISGAASGAATGIAIGGSSGGIWGAAIGGVIGILSGIFGAKEAKRQREIQEAQLAEQRKLVALQERQAMLAYSASVVGQMTNQGVVTSVERDAYGNLVADIKGKDLQLVLERNKSGR